MSAIQTRLECVRATIPHEVDLVAVSKFHPIAEIRDCYELGQRCFGESHEQELRIKQKELPKDIAWHFIGHSLFSRCINAFKNSYCCACFFYWIAIVYEHSFPFKV